MVKLKVNTKLLPMKGHYFLYNGATAPVVPYMSTYAKQLGFTSAMVGTLYTVLPVAGMVAKPLFGGLADRLKFHKQFFILFIALTGVFFFGMKFIPEVSQTEGQPSSLDCGSQTEIRSCGHTPDDCAIEKLIAATGNETTMCNVYCPSVLSSEWNNDLCKNWNLSEYCVQPAMINHTHPLSFVGSVPIHHTTMVEDCLFFYVKTASFPDSRTVIPFCDTSIHTYDCKVSCNDPTVNDLVSKKLVEDTKEILTSATFWTFCIFMFTSWIAMAVVVSIGDAICFELLGEKHANYGQQRVWGSVGWGLMSIISGLLLDWASQGKPYKEYDIVFYITFFMIILNVLASINIHVSQTKMSASILRDVGRLLSEIRINIFLVWCIAVGMCTGLLWNFLFWHLEDLALAQGCDGMEWMKTLQGLVMGVQCFGGEVPFFFISGWVIKKIGHINSMSLVLFGFGVRFFGYYWLVNPWWVLPIELLNGVTFGIFYATMASYASIAAPPGTEATVQGFVGAVFEGIGVSLGSFVGGILYGNIGGARTFRLFAICSLILFALHVVGQYLLERRRKSRGQASIPEEHCKEFQMTRYATPSDAIQMLDDQFDSSQRLS